MNLAQLRQDNMVPRFLEAAKAEGLQFPDQDVLNQLCKDRILGLPPYYNSIRTFFCLSIKGFSALLFGRGLGANTATWYNTLYRRQTME